MNQLKIALIIAPALVTLDYEEGAGEIVLAIDISLTKWGVILGQVEKNRKRYIV